MDEKNQRKERQEQLAKVFYEMGMDYEIVEKISGLTKEEIKKIVDKNNEIKYNDLV